MMILVDSGRIVDYTAEEGCYEVFLSSSPSMFNGELKDSVRESFERFKFGGQPGKSQQVYFINLQEIRGIKFGTRNALQYFDNFYNAELFVRCHGSYSDEDHRSAEILHGSRTTQRIQICTFDALGDQFNMEFLDRTPVCHRSDVRGRCPHLCPAFQEHGTVQVYGNRSGRGLDTGTWHGYLRRGHRQHQLRRREQGAHQYAQPGRYDGRPQCP